MSDAAEFDPKAFLDRNAQCIRGTDLYIVNPIDVEDAFELGRKQAAQERHPLPPSSADPLVCAERLLVSHYRWMLNVYGNEERAVMSMEPEYGDDLRRIHEVIEAVRLAGQKGQR